MIIRRRPLMYWLPAFHGGNTGSIPVGRASRQIKPIAA
jgi:hypothetical protein